MPLIHVLSPEHARRLLQRNQVARIAYSFHDRVTIEPIHYVFHKESLYVRTSVGAKLTQLKHNPYVALEVDEIHSLFDWSSVVVHGFVEILNAEEDPNRHAEAVAHLRLLVPNALREGDPMPHRQIVMRIHASEIEARGSTST